MSVFEDRYTVGRQLGEGAYAKVQLVTSIADGQQYADKVYSEAADYNELNITSSFDHPNLLHRKDVCLDTNGIIHLVLPLADSDLSTYLWKHLKTITAGERFDRTVSIMYQIISGVVALNKFGYFHCDLKPQNILMFGDKPVVADYSLTRGGANRVVPDVPCGTPFYKDPQTLGQQLKRMGDESVGEAFMQTLTEQRPSYDQADVFSIGTIMYEIYFDSRLIPRDEGENAFSEYLNYEQKLANQLAAASSDNDRKILACVQRCVTFRLEDRARHAEDILQCDLFADKVMTKPIPAKMLANHIPTKKWCEEQVPNKPMKFQRVTAIVVEWVYEVIAKVLRNSAQLLVYTVFTTLFYRCLHKIDKVETAQLYAAACLLLAVRVSVTTKIDTADVVYIAAGAFTGVELEKTMVKLAVYFEGVLRIPSVYDVTDNALEILWWVQQVQKDCTFLEKSPQECHDLYSQMETAKPELLMNRVNKDLVISATFSQAGKVTIKYYKAYSDFAEEKVPETIRVTV